MLLLTLSILNLSNIATKAVKFGTNDDFHLWFWDLLELQPPFLTDFETFWSLDPRRVRRVSHTSARQWIARARELSASHSWIGFAMNCACGRIRWTRNSIHGGGGMPTSNHDAIASIHDVISVNSSSKMTHSVNSWSEARNHEMKFQFMTRSVKSFKNEDLRWKRAF